MPTHDEIWDVLDKGQRGPTSLATEIIELRSKVQEMAGYCGVLKGKLEGAGISIGASDLLLLTTSETDQKE